MLFLALAFPVVEIYLLFHIGGMIGVANTFFFILASGVFGYGLIRAQGAYLARNFATLVPQGKVPADAMFRSGLNFLAGILFFAPGFISTAMGLLLILPGTRQLIALVLKAKFAKAIANGTFAFSPGGSAGGFTFGGFGGGFGGGAGGPFGNGAGSPFGAGGPFANRDPRAGMRDVSPRELDGHTTGTSQVGDSNVDDSSAAGDIIDITPVKKD